MFEFSITFSIQILKFYFPRKSNDIIFIASLNSKLNELGIVLQELPKPEATAVPNNKGNKILEVSLSILSGILGALLVTLLVIYFIKSRSYNRQIKSLTESAFGSTSTDLNRNIQKLPNTNVFSHEQSNPVMNNAKLSKGDLDTQSIISSDSDDFAGLGDNPIFNVRKDKDDNRNPFGLNVRDNQEAEGSSYI